MVNGVYFGYSLANGDFINNGYEDLAIGISGGNSDTGYVSIIYGSETGLTDAENQLISQGTAGVKGAPESNDRFGFPFASGDFEHDEHADISIWIPWYDNVGWIQTIYGSDSGLTSEGNQLQPRPWNPRENQTMQNFFLPCVDSDGNLSAIGNTLWDGYKVRYGNPGEQYRLREHTVKIPDHGF